MDHGAGVAVKIQDEIVRHEIADHHVHIHGGGGIFAAEGLQGGDEAGFVSLRAGGLGVVKNVGVAVGVVVDVLQEHVGAAAAAGKIAAAHVGRAAGEAVGHLPVGEAGGGVRSGVFRCVRRCVFRCVLRRIRHGEVLAVAAAAAHFGAVGLIQLAVVAAVAALQEGLLHSFHRQIKPPVLAVHGEVGVAAQGGGHTHLLHHLIAKVVLHIGVVLNDIV